MTMIATAGPPCVNVRVVSAATAMLVVLCGCAVQQPRETTELVTEALPETTEVPAEWSAAAEDTGEVDDGWLTEFRDPQLEALAAEALDNNLNLRLAATQVDRAAGLARSNITVEPECWARIP